jgi:hypothetical protein
VIAGPAGTGRSHLVEALAHAAIEKDLRVAWSTLETPTAAVGKAEANGSGARDRDPDLGSAAPTSSSSMTLPCCPPGRTPPRRFTGSPTAPTNDRLSDQQHPPGWLRHHHAEGPGDGNRRPTAAPRRLAEALAGNGVIPLAT